MKMEKNLIISHLCRDRKLDVKNKYHRPSTVENRHLPGIQQRQLPEFVPISVHLQRCDRWLDFLFLFQLEKHYRLGETKNFF